MTDVDELLARMTIEEKCAQLAGVWFAELATDHVLDPAKLDTVLTRGIGQVARVSAQTGAAPADTAEMANQIQRHLVEQTRLGIPAIVHEESTGGFCARQATQFPHGPGLAATWDPGLAEEVATVIGRQLRAVGARMTLAPVVDVARDPRWGRVEETYGEDPELASRMAVAYVRGVQSQGVLCAVKHFVGHGAHEGGLNWGWVSAGPRHLRDVLAAPFRAAINEAGAGGIMPSYNEVDGLPLHGSRELLTDLLRDELGFEGVTVADYFGVSNLRDFHRTAVDAADASRQALLAGLDVELPSYDCYRTLPEQVEAGGIDIDVIDAACRRVLVQKVELGLFDDPYVDAGAASPRSTRRRTGPWPAEPSPSPSWWSPTTGSSRCNGAGGSPCWVPAPTTPAASWVTTTSPRTSSWPPPTSPRKGRASATCSPRTPPRPSSRPCAGGLTWSTTPPARTSPWSASGAAAG